MVSWVQVLVIIGFNLLVAAFVYGQLTQRVKDMTFTLARHDKVLDDHSQLLTDHESRISHVQGSTAALPCLRDPSLSCPHGGRTSRDARG